MQPAYNIKTFYIWAELFKNVFLLACLKRVTFPFQLRIKISIFPMWSHFIFGSSCIHLITKTKIATKNKKLPVRKKQATEISIKMIQSYCLEDVFMNSRMSVVKLSFTSSLKCSYCLPKVQKWCLKLWNCVQAFFTAPILSE